MKNESIGAVRVGSHKVPSAVDEIKAVNTQLSIRLTAEQECELERKLQLAESCERWQREDLERQAAMSPEEQAAQEAAYARNQEEYRKAWAAKKRERTLKREERLKKSKYYSPVVVLSAAEAAELDRQRRSATPLILV